MPKKTLNATTAEELASALNTANPERNTVRAVISERLAIVVEPDFQSMKVRVYLDGGVAASWEAHQGDKILAAYLVAVIMHREGRDVRDILEAMAKAT